MFTSGFKVLLFGAKQPFARGAPRCRAAPVAVTASRFAERLAFCDGCHSFFLASSPFRRARKRPQLRHTPKCEKYSIFESISVSGQICGKTFCQHFLLLYYTTLFHLLQYRFLQDFNNFFARFFFSHFLRINFWIFRQTKAVFQIRKVFLCS